MSISYWIEHTVILNYPCPNIIKIRHQQNDIYRIFFNAYSLQ